MSVFKIAPGKNAKFWENGDCLRNRHICVGWGKVCNLRKYHSEDELAAAVNLKHYGGRAPGVARKTARQLWTLRNLRPGRDTVVANKGNSIVLRVGTVAGPYKWDAKHDYPHTVSVDWGPDCERQRIRRQKEWYPTIVPVPPALFKLITRKLASEYAASQKELTIDGELDEECRVLRRTEQSFLRNRLLNGKDHGRCFLCDEDLPAALLVAAHIKKRARCSDKEKRDYRNVVPMCLLGCDALFERGYVAVVRNVIDARLKSLHTRSRLSALLLTLRSRRLEVEVPRKKYFKWHSKHAR